jgi:hypothetical protein
MKRITIQNVRTGSRKEWWCEKCWFNRLVKAAKIATDPKMKAQLEATLAGARKRYGKSHP